MSAAIELETKKDFAARVEVSQGRISQWIKQGKISADAIEGEGRSAKIRVAQALKDLDLNLDMSQRLGNGAQTKIQPKESAEDPAAGLKPKSVFDELQEQKLIKEKAATARLLEEEKLRKGIYCRVADVRSGYTEIALGMLRSFEGSLPQIANAISAEFKLSNRDVVHLIKSEWKKIQADVAQAAEANLSQLPETLEDDTGLAEFSISDEITN